MNILEAIRNARGKYIWLFRTKDYVISETIESVLEVLKEKSNVSYMTSSCVDENENPVITYQADETVCAGRDALLRHGRLYIHPSGSIYRRDCIDVDELESFLIGETDPVTFIYLCSLMRLCCALKGDFFLMEKVTWIYTNTAKSRVISGNANNNAKKGFIYDPKLSYMRYKAEMKYTDRKLSDGKLKEYIFARLFGRYLVDCTWFLWKGFNDKDFCQHYGIETKTIDMDEERGKYLEVVNDVEDKYGLVHAEYYQDLKDKYLNKNTEYCLKLQGDRP